MGILSKMLYHSGVELATVFWIIIIIALISEQIKNWREWVKELAIGIVSMIIIILLVVISPIWLTITIAVLILLGILVLATSDELWLYFRKLRRMDNFRDIIKQDWSFLTAKSKKLKSSNSPDIIWEAERLGYEPEIFVQEYNKKIDEFIDMEKGRENRIKVAKQRMR